MELRYRKQMNTYYTWEYAQNKYAKKFYLTHGFEIESEDEVNIFITNRRGQKLKVSDLFVSYINYFL